MSYPLQRRLLLLCGHWLSFWMRLSFCTNDLLAWAQRIGRKLALDSTWPWTRHLLTAIQRVRTRLRITHRDQTRLRNSSHMKDPG